MTAQPTGETRRLFSSFIWGKRINSVSLQAEAWFWRIVASADDLGNLPAEIERLCASTKGLRTHVRARQVAAWCTELVNAGLVAPYVAAGEPHYHIIGYVQWQVAVTPNGKPQPRYPEHPPSLDARDHEEDNRVNPDESRLIQKIQIVPHSSRCTELWDSSESAAQKLPKKTTNGKSTSHKNAREKFSWNAKDGFGNIDAADWDDWARAFPACDAKRQVAAAHAWLVANPSRTKSNYRRFLTNWLMRAQERGGEQKGAAYGNGKHDHRADKRSREYAEDIALPDSIKV